MEKIKLFTHTDLDGVGCEILGRLMYSSIDVERLDYGNCDKRITSFVVSGDMAKYDKVFITDLNLDAATIVVLNSLVENSNVEIRLFDHHKQSLVFNELPWVVAVTDIQSENIRFENKLHQTCGTELFWEMYFRDKVSKESVDLIKRIEEFVYYVTMRDTGHFDVLEAVSLNDMMKLYGTDEFIELMAGRLILGESLIQQMDVNHLNMETKQKMRYLEKMENHMEWKYMNGHRFGVVFADRYISELGQHLNTKHPDCDFVAMIDMHGTFNGNITVSLRTIHDHIDLSKIAAMYGGGGHPKASGFTIDAGARDYMVFQAFALPEEDENPIRPGRWSFEDADDKNETEGEDNVEERQAETVEV